MSRWICEVKVQQQSVQHDGLQRRLHAPSTGLQQPGLECTRTCELVEGQHGLLHGDVVQPGLLHEADAVAEIVQRLTRHQQRGVLQKQLCGVTMSPQVAIHEKVCSLTPRRAHCCTAQGSCNVSGCPAVLHGSGRQSTLTIGWPIAFAMNGTVRDARGFASIMYTWRWRRHRSAWCLLIKRMLNLRCRMGGRAVLSTEQQQTRQRTCPLSCCNAETC